MALGFYHHWKWLQYSLKRQILKTKFDDEETSKCSMNRNNLLFE